MTCTSYHLHSERRTPQKSLRKTNRYGSRALLQFGPRLLCRSSIAELCLLRTALTARVSRRIAFRAGLLGSLRTVLASAPLALVLADASSAALPARAPLALVLPAHLPSALLAQVR